MVDFSNNWFLYLVIAANIAFMVVLLFVSVSEAMTPD